MSTIFSKHRGYCPYGNDCQDWGPGKYCEGCLDDLIAFADMEYDRMREREEDGLPPVSRQEGDAGERPGED